MTDPSKCRWCKKSYRVSTSIFDGGVAEWDHPHCENAYRAGLDAAAKVVDDANLAGPYAAIACAPMIRALADKEPQ